MEFVRDKLKEDGQIVNCLLQNAINWFTTRDFVHYNIVYHTVFHLLSAYRIVNTPS